MWGCISTEASYQLNFNTGFSSSRSNVLIHLAQWQYWWWFWFAFLWSFYYLVMLKVIRFRTLKMKPKVVTSYRPHGKWGDFLAAIIPSLWCLNILANSNFILRLVEWQNECSVFLIRVRAKQWYWIYKFEMKNLIDMLSVPKNIGRNRWFFSNFSEIQYSENYFNTLRLKSKILKTEDFWTIVFRDIDQSNLELNSFFIEALENEQNHSTLKNINFNQNLFYKNFFFTDYLWNVKNWKLKSKFKFSLVNLSKLNLKHSNIVESNPRFHQINQRYFNFFFAIKNSTLNSHSNFDLFSRFFKKNAGTSVPFRLKKTPLSILRTEKQKPFEGLFKVSFNDGYAKLYPKQSNDVFLFTIKQLRYRRRLSIPDNIKYNKDKTVAFRGKTILLNNNIFNHYLEKPELYYKLNQKNKNYSEKLSIPLTKRLLRVKRTLVLPAHINITVITNSFDVVHSWFIPGLGLKLDCVPGRSTHHTLYIDNVGFYYGQCAEVCGRYHHHMPIRVCALPFEHFLMWWNTFGLPRIMFSKKNKFYCSNFAFRKFLW